MEELNSVTVEPVSEPEPPRRLSAKVTRCGGSSMTEAEIEAAEEEALTWAHRSSCC